jgi:hypothetical protein
MKLVSMRYGLENSFDPVHLARKLKNSGKILNEFSTQNLIELGRKQNSGLTQRTARSPTRLQKHGLASALLCATTLSEGLGCHSLRPPRPKLAQNDANRQSRSDGRTRLSDVTKPVP